MLGCQTGDFGRDGSASGPAAGSLPVRTVGEPLQTFWIDERRGMLVDEAQISDLGSFLTDPDNSSPSVDNSFKTSPVERGVVLWQDATHKFVLDHRRPRIVKSDHTEPLQPIGQLAHAQEVTSMTSCPRWQFPPTQARMLLQSRTTLAPAKPLPLLARYQHYDVVGIESGPALLSRSCNRNVVPLARPMVLVKSGVGGCVLDATSAHGPDAIVTRLSWVVPEINCVTTDVNQPTEYDRPDPDLRAHDKYLAQSEIVYELQEQVAAAVADSGAEGRVVLVLSGAHTTAVGTVAGVVRNHPGARVGLIWIDAHPDINTPGSTLSGNPHGMPVAAMAGLAYPDDVAWWPKDNPVDPATVDAIITHWARYHQELMAGQAVALDDILFVGIRDIDPWEKFIIEDRKIAVASVEATHQSRHAVLEQAKRVMDGCDVIVINIDVDSLDKKYATGTGTPVENGLEPSELYELASLLVSAFADRVAAIEITETDPVIDVGAQVQTLDYAVELTQRILQGLQDARR